MKTKTKRKTVAKRRLRAQRPLHKRFLLHPATVFFMLCFGILLIAITVNASALDVAITAKVPAPALQSPAVIQIIAPADSPAAGQETVTATTPETSVHVSDKQILLTGECPKDSHIEFYRNSIFAGVTSCIGDPTFSIQIDLVEGLNTIVAHVFNITEDEGPLAQTLYITYDVPAAATVSSAGTSRSAAVSGSAKAASAQFLLTSNFRYLGFIINQRGSWNINIKGGRAPYTFKFNWGDGAKTTMTRSGMGEFTMHHMYHKASSKTGYVISASATDDSGSMASIQLVSIVSNPNSPTASLVNVANASLNPSIFISFKKWLWLVWPAYGLIILMGVSFWLGERQELSALRRRGSGKRRS